MNWILRTGVLLPSLFSILFMSSCTSSFLTREDDSNNQIDIEFSKKVKIESIEEKKVDQAQNENAKDGADAEERKTSEQIDREKKEAENNKKAADQLKERIAANQKRLREKEKKDQARRLRAKQEEEKRRQENLKKKRDAEKKKLAESKEKKAKPQEGKDDKSELAKKTVGADATTDEVAKSAEDPQNQDSSTPGDVAEENSTPVDSELVHEPRDVEDSVGFIGRRPVVDPFRVGEKVRFRVTYFGVAAGFLTLETKPFVQVNDRKHYSFALSLKSSDVFSMFYKVEDWATTYMDYETLLPTTFQLDVKETGQLRDTRAFFDWENLEATMWEKKYTKSAGDQNRKLTWKILPYAQNVFTAAFYMRTFTFKVGQEYAFRVADDGKNILFRGKIIRREKLKTDVGTFNTIVLKPDIEIDGIMEPTGDIFFWLTDDDRKLIVKIESKIKIGTIKAFLESIDYGKK